MAKSNAYRVIRKMALYLPDATMGERTEAVEKLRRLGVSSETIHKCMIADLDWRSQKSPNLKRLTTLVETTSREMMLRRKRPQTVVNHSQYYKIWRIVDGAVKDALYNHPDYLTAKGKVSARESIVKRATGAVKGFTEGWRGEPKG